MAFAWRRLLIFVCAHSAKASVAPDRPSMLMIQPISSKNISMLKLQSLSWSSFQNRLITSLNRCCAEANGWNCSTNKTDKKMPKPKDSKTRRVAMARIITKNGGIKDQADRIKGLDSTLTSNVGLGW